MRRLGAIRTAGVMSLLLATRFFCGPAIAAIPAIGLELRLPPRPRPPSRKAGQDSALEDLAQRSLPKPRYTVEFRVIIRGLGPGDVFFDKNAVGLDLSDESGTPVPSHCKYKRGLEHDADYVTLHRGATIAVRRFTDSCLSTVPGGKYAVVATFEDLAGIGGFPMRPDTPEGATLVTRRTVSNKIRLRWPAAETPQLR